MQYQVVLSLVLRFEVLWSPAMLKVNTRHRPPWAHRGQRCRLDWTLPCEGHGCAGVFQGKDRSGWSKDRGNGQSGNVHVLLAWTWGVRSWTKGSGGERARTAAGRAGLWRGPGHLAETRRAFRGGFEATSVTSAAQCGSVYVTRRRVGSNSCDPVKERRRSAQLP